MVEKMNGSVTWNNDCIFLNNFSGDIKINPDKGNFSINIHIFRFSKVTPLGKENKDKEQFLPVRPLWEDCPVPDVAASSLMRKEDDATAIEVNEASGELEANPLELPNRTYKEPKKRFISKFSEHRKDNRNREISEKIVEYIKSKGGQCSFKFAISTKSSTDSIREEQEIYQFCNSSNISFAVEIITKDDSMVSYSSLSFSLCK